MNLINNKLFFLYVFPMLIFFQGCGDHKDVIQHPQDNIIGKTDIPLNTIKSSLEIEPTPELTYEEFTDHATLSYNLKYLNKYHQF